MTDNKEYETLVGVIIDADSRLTLAQLCRLCAVHADYVIELVDEGLIQPYGEEMTQWHFTGLSIQRTRKARRLQTDLGINLAGVAVILQLLDEVDHLRLRIKDLEP
ncbi:MAG: MerR family transcriptional regulator [Gammaproteobacteria bacterium]|nr:MerR family transcriptional regulator [Gammaproteobacteria bacterium]MBQ0838640.1 MerR family transcriptional regulator [Gammaproteobacteria bacterium]